MSDLKGKRILVTGIASGIGKATAIEVAKCGAQVAGFDFNQKEGEKTINEILAFGGNANFFKVNIMNEQEVETAVLQANKWMGNIDVLLQIAGVMGGAMVDIRELEEDVWDEVLNINLKGSFLVVKHVCKIMIPNKKGTIIFSHYRSGGTQLKLIVRNVLNDFYKINHQN